MSEGGKKGETCKTDVAFNFMPEQIKNQNLIFQFRRWAFCTDVCREKKSSCGTGHF
jgi:hypothetical protein